MSPARYHNIRKSQVLKERGMTNVAIAQRLGVSEATVRRLLKKNLVDAFFELNPQFVPDI